MSLGGSCNRVSVSSSQFLRHYSLHLYPGEVAKMAISHMAATSSALWAPSASSGVCEFNGLRANRGFGGKSLCKTMMPKFVSGKGALGARCDYIGSSTNLIVSGSTALLLFAGRFGLAPSANKIALSGLKLVDRPAGLQTGDPAGFTLADTLAFGALGHIIGVGIVLGLKATAGLQ